MDRRGFSVASTLKPLCFVLCALPMAWLAGAAFTNSLGPNPIEALTRGTGDWAVRLLLIGLAIRPLSRFRPLRRVMSLRRMVGLFAFTYAVLHLSSYLVLDQFFDWSAIWADLVKRTYITIGMAAFLMLVALAATSTNAMIKRLGAANWQWLHRLVYAAAALAVVHYYMMTKAKTLFSDPVLYGVILLLLLILRLPFSKVRARVRKPAPGVRRQLNG